MTLQGCGIVFRPVCAVVLAAAFALPGCASSSMEDAAAQSAASAGPADTGAYPNLNIQPVAATAQLTEAERAAATAELEATRQRVSGARGAASSDQRRLRKLAATHDEETLRRIEGE